MEWSFVIGSGVLATLMAYQISVAYDEPFPRLEQRAVQTQEQRMEPLQEWGMALWREPAGEMTQINEQTQEHIQNIDPICEDEGVGIEVGSQHQTSHRTMGGSGVTDADTRPVGERNKTV